MRTFLVLLSIVAALSGKVYGQQPASVRDPWNGFGLGSSVRMRTQVEVDGKTVKDETKTCKVQSISSTGSAGIWTRTMTNGKPRVFTSYHVHGGDPQQLGLKLESKKDAALTIDGKELRVTVSQWVSAKDKKELESIARPFPELMKQGGLRGVKNVDVRLTFYEAQSLDVEVPYHEIATPGRDVAVGPRAVKTEFRFTRLRDDGKPVAETHFVETVRKLKTELAIKDKKARCMVFDVVMSQWDKKHKAPAVRKGEVWYSNDVPGREVKKELVGEAPDGKGKTTFLVEDFEVLPAVPKLDLAKLIADKQRPRIPDPTWNQMRLGAWSLSVSEIVDRDTKRRRHFDVVLTRVVQLHQGGAYVTAAKKLTDRGWQDHEYHLVESPEPRAKAEEQIVREVILLVGEKAPCEKRTRKENSEWSTRTTSEWLPLDEKWQKVLARTGLKHVKQSEVVLAKDSFAEHKMKSAGAITSLDAATFVAGNAVSCVAFKTRHWEGEKPWFNDYTYHSNDVPRWRVGSISVGMRDFSFSHVLDFGEAEKAVPGIEQLRGYYEKAMPLLKTVELDRKGTEKDRKGDAAIILPPGRP